MQNTMPQPITTRKPDIPELTGLRFIAAFCILIAHTVHWLCYQYDPIPQPVSMVMRLAGIAMPLFFVLSGFVIHYNYNHYFKTGIAKKYLQFAWIRFARLYPLYIFCIALCLLCFHFGIRPNSAYAEDTYIASKLPYFFTLTQSLFFKTYENAFHFSQIILGISWSVSTEFFFYLCYPGVAYFILNRLNLRKLCFVSIAFFICAYCILYFLYTHQSGLQDVSVTLKIANAENKNILSYWFFYLSPYIRIFEFIAGCLAAHFVVVFTNTRISNTCYYILKTFVYIASISIIVLTYIPLHPFLAFMKMNFLLTLPIYLLLCMLGVISSAQRSVHLYSNTIIVRLGTISYSLYLMQAFTLTAAMLLFQLKSDSENVVLVYVIKCILSILMTIGISFITYRCIEEPGKNFLRKLLQKPPIGWPTKNILNLFGYTKHS